MKRILVATDGSEHADHALELASDLSEKYDAELIILHVVPERPLAADDRRLAEIEFAEEIKKYPGGSVPTDIAGPGKLGMRAIVRQHEKTDRVLRTMIGTELLQRTKRDAKRYGAKAVEIVLAEGEPAAKIIETAKNKNANSIVMGSRGLGSLGDLFLGSVSHKVSHLSDIKVITVT